jgi:hypothetical protein
MSWIKQYSLSNDIASQAIKNSDLCKEIMESTISSASIISVTSGNDFSFTNPDTPNPFSIPAGNPDLIEILFDVELSAADKTSLDALVLAHNPTSLDKYKTAKNDAIDTRTGELIAAGHTYLGKVFSLSERAQINLLGLDNSKDELTYPISYSTKDNTDKISLADATEVHAFYLNALATKKAHLDSGNALIDQVNAATDKAGVDAVIDNR